MKPPLDTRSLDPARVFRPAPETVRWTHLEAVQAVAEQLYPYPTPEFPHLRTFVNEPEVNQRVFTNYGRELTPDIVALEWPEHIVKIVAEVATPGMLTTEDAWEAWLPESRLQDVAFYLYVPAGYLKPFRLLLKDAGIKRKDVTLRTWRRIVGLRMLDIAFIDD
jgi:hypothetical protein